MGKKGKPEKSLGRSLIKDRFGHGKKRTLDNNSLLHTTEIKDGYDWGRLNLQSVTEESSFQEFLRTAELAGTEFQAEKLNISFVNPKSNVGLLGYTEKIEAEKKHEDKKGLLKIPRRPKWSVETTPEELQQMENDSFLEWRRGLALLQEDEGILMTPYEKNLDFWRQLWRVVERSDVVAQIVDARNPLLFRSEDLEKYVTEIGENKMNMILINKADFLTDQQRITWAEFFDLQGIKVVFFSALQTVENLKKIKEEEQNVGENEEDSDSIDKITTLSTDELTKSANELLEKVNSTEEKLMEIEKKLGIDSDVEIEDGNVKDKNNPKILSGEELILLFKNIHKGSKVTNGITTIGLVGYPNVGKSSTINALLTEKKTSVSATPGKTKHFQTLYLDKDLLLCDCPGLVMPSFVLTKAEMVLNGILPIDQMRDHVPPINLLCTYIPRHILEDKYGIMIPKPLEGEDPNRPPFSEELLLAYGYNRGFMTANGQPDQARSARYVLKDFVNGKLLFAYAPPSVKQEDFHKFPERQKVVNRILPPQEQRALKLPTATTSSSELDKQFFASQSGSAYIKGKTNFPHIRPTSGTSIDNVNMSMESVHISKPWKKQKQEKKEKLRRKFAHLDQH